jgi:hypothetical protein
MRQQLTGGCQCGAVRYEVTLDLGKVISCNCSRCAKLGWLIAPAAMDDFRLVKGEGSTADYQFHKHVIHHVFCSTCGIQSFAYGIGSDGKQSVAINARCLDGIDPDGLDVQKFNGRDL